MNKDKLIEAMAKAAYKASERASFDERVRGDAMAFYKILQEAALQALLGELPDDFDIVCDNTEPPNRIKVKLWDELLAMKEPNYMNTHCTDQTEKDNY